MFSRLLIALIFVVVTQSYVFADAQFLKEQSPNFGQLSIFKGSELCAVSKATNQYLRQHKDDVKAVHAGKAIGNGISLGRVEQTLDFLCQIYQEDVRANRNSRLHDGAFLKANFEFIRWIPDKEKADEIARKSTNSVKSRMLNQIPNKQLFLTKYYAKLLDGSAVKTDHYSQALYQLPSDEQHFSLEQAELKKDQLTRFRYTRQEVMEGALLNKKLAKPLVWVTEEALHDVLLQGTGVLTVDGKIRYFNVHRNNGIDYDYAIGKREQKRYWYFAEVPSILGYGKELKNKIAIKPQVSLAGNVKQLGLGKLILVNYQLEKRSQAQLAILADEGGAFDDNLFQLDLLAGSYRGWGDYHQANKHIPDYADIWILLKKEE
ncbi:acetate--CoA ligase [Thalassotalea sp. M1531]|uniref:Acetate--CoA ligase n=1 Tax=Thalassotalea algicola TaxID=2716224 RepID=A0A7Y0LA64_9GAMM|nr:MltA domain-containing protein [Thalassotalea algicola]NMP30458.1 acetate--CoA ligase [Thalassotalea algicola]